MIEIPSHRRLLIKTIILLVLFTCVRAINQKCINSSPSASDSNASTQPSGGEQCPTNSVCNNQGYCVCGKGYFGNCQIKGEYIGSELKQFTITQNLTYYIITPTINQYVYYQFILCNQQSLNNEQLLNLWDEDGNLQEPTSKNALGIDKNVRTSEGCTNLMTPFFSFGMQANGEKQLLIFGIRLKNPGSMKIGLTVQEAQLFGFDILFKIILILISGIALISFGGLVYCIYKCKRRNRRVSILNEERYDISYFDEYMPRVKVSLKQMKQEICSVCLGEFKQDQEMRHTLCGHYFHQSCLDEWCVTNLSCPICRSSLDKGNLIHLQYVLHRRQSTTTDDDSVIEKDSVIDNQSLRRPIV